MTAAPNNKRTWAAAIGTDVQLPPGVVLSPAQAAKVGHHIPHPALASNSALDTKSAMATVEFISPQPTFPRRDWAVIAVKDFCILNFLLRTNFPVEEIQLELEGEQFSSNPRSSVVSVSHAKEKPTKKQKTEAEGISLLQAYVSDEGGIIVDCRITTFTKQEFLVYINFYVGRKGEVSRGCWCPDGSHAHSAVPCPNALKLRSIPVAVVTNLPAQAPKAIGILSWKIMVDKARQAGQLLTLDEKELAVPLQTLLEFLWGLLEGAGDHNITLADLESLPELSVATTTTHVVTEEGVQWFCKRYVWLLLDLLKMNEFRTMWREGYVLGWKPREAIEQLFAGRPAGSCLLRLSSSEGQLVVSYVTPGGSLQHTKIGLEERKEKGAKKRKEKCFTLPLVVGSVRTKDQDASLLKLLKSCKSPKFETVYHPMSGAWRDMETLLRNVVVNDDDNDDDTDGTERYAPMSYSQNNAKAAAADSGGPSASATRTPIGPLSMLLPTASVDSAGSGYSPHSAPASAPAPNMPFYLPPPITSNPGYYAQMQQLMAPGGQSILLQSYGASPPPPDYVGESTTAADSANGGGMQHLPPASSGTLVVDPFDGLFQLDQ